MDIEIQNYMYLINGVLQNVMRYSFTLFVRPLFYPKYILIIGGKIICLLLSGCIAKRM